MDSCVLISITGSGPSHSRLMRFPFRYTGPFHYIGVFGFKYHCAFLSGFHHRFGETVLFPGTLRFFFQWAPPFWGLSRVGLFWQQGRRLLIGKDLGVSEPKGSCLVNGCSPPHPALFRQDDALWRPQVGERRRYLLLTPCELLRWSCSWVRFKKAISFAAVFFFDQKFAGFTSTYKVLFPRVLIAFTGFGHEDEKLDLRSPLAPSAQFCFPPLCVVWGASCFRCFLCLSLIPF
jgi:hypothetical protein